MYVLLICFVVFYLSYQLSEFDVLIVCRQHNDKEWKKFKKQHAKMWAKRYCRRRGFNIAEDAIMCRRNVRTIVMSVVCRQLRKINLDFRC